MSNVSDVAAATGLRTYEEYKQSLRNTGSELGKNQFLQLLAAQMQYQDPLEPSKDTDFIAQMAQFSSLEQMENLNNTMTNSQYYGLAGKYVSTNITLDDGRTGTIVGVVDSVFTNSGTSYAELGNCMFIDENNEYSALDGSYVVQSSSINQVYDNDLFKTPDAGKGVSLLDAAALIGKVITASIIEAVTEKESVPVTDEDGNPVEDENGDPVMEEKEVTKDKSSKVSGRVTGVTLEDNDIVVTIDDGSESGMKVSIGSIIDINESI